MRQHDVDAVHEIECAAYAFPWSRGNFIDSLAADHVCQLLCDSSGELLGYFVVLPAFQEMHLLNLTVAPAEQGRGWGRFLLGRIAQHCRDCAARELWLEVRQGNRRAQRVYERFGFETRGVRKGYYPAPFGDREDAIVMCLKVAAPESGGPVDALE
jgi:[ribosomal protein S18]-alanine N-acetyltransferase